jgi:hypothetical protein
MYGTDKSNKINFKENMFLVGFKKKRDSSISLRIAFIPLT